MRLPQQPGQGQPKTLAAALVALAESRKYAARLAATARAQKVEEQQRLTELAKLREGLAEVKRGLAVERDDAAQTKDRLGKVEDQRNAKTKESHKRLRQVERLLKRLKRAENDVKQKQAEPERKLREAQSDLARICEERIQQIKALTGEAETLRKRVEEVEQTLKMRDEEFSQERKHPTGKRDLVELLQHRLADEQERRIAAEKRIMRLLSELDSKKRTSQADSRPISIPPSAAPSQYQELAISVGYDFARDPLFDLMRRDVLVADRYADWQAKHLLRLTSRRRDSEQSLDEQAYAAAMAARWRLIDHPHLRLGSIPRWALLGTLLDDKSEKYLLMITNERIEEMQGRIGSSG